MSVEQRNTLFPPINEELIQEATQTLTQYEANLPVGLAKRVPFRWAIYYSGLGLDYQWLGRTDRFLTANKIITPIVVRNRKFFDRADLLPLRLLTFPLSRDREWVKEGHDRTLPEASSIAFRLSQQIPGLENSYNRDFFNEEGRFTYMQQPRNTTNTLPIVQNDRWQPVRRGRPPKNRKEDIVTLDMTWVREEEIQFAARIPSFSEEEVHELSKIKNSYELGEKMLQIKPNDAIVDSSQLPLELQKLIYIASHFYTQYFPVIEEGSKIPLTGMVAYEQFEHFAYFVVNKHPELPKLRYLPLDQVLALLKEEIKERFKKVFGRSGKDLAGYY